MKKEYVTIYTSKDATRWLRDLGYDSYQRYAYPSLIFVIVERRDAPTLREMLSEAGFIATYS